MDEAYTTFRTDTRAPVPLPPPGSCDCQAHVFGDPARYPLRPGRAYQPPNTATIDELVKMHRALGIDRGVIVQTSSHGPNHGILYDALAGRPNYRGIALIDDTVSDAELARLHAAGVRGARFNFWNNLKIAPSAADFTRAIARIAELGWHAKIHASGEELIQLKDLLGTVRIPAVIDHMAHMDIKRGLDQPAVAAILEYLQRDNWWVMVSSGDRNSAMDRGWDDVVPFAAKFIDAAPDRVIWCTDWPHLQYSKPMPNDAELLELCYRFAPDAAMRHKILVDNPARLFGFED